MRTVWAGHKSRPVPEPASVSASPKSASPNSPPPKSLPTLVEELWELVVAYARQETVEPLKSLGRFVLFGALGAMVLGIGLVLLILAGLRALQTETGTNFTGHLSWLPYLFAMIVCGVVAIVAITRVDKGPARKHGEP